MTRLFLHICGDSGVGKKTLVKKLVDDSIPGLRERFGIDGPLGAYAHYPYRGVNQIYGYVYAKEEIVLHNWQLATHGWIAHNDKAHPKAEQCIYLLWQPYEIHRKNLIERADRDPKEDSDVYKWRPDANELKLRWNQDIIPLFQQVQRWGLNVEVVNASTMCYEPMPEWPV